MFVFNQKSEAAIRLCLQAGSVLGSNANLGLYGQGLLKLTGHGDTIRGQRLSLSLFYNITVSH